MIYIKDDIFAELTKIDYNMLSLNKNDFLIKPILKKMSDTSIDYYNNTKKIYKNYQLWFNPAKYIYSFEQHYNESFFTFNSDNLIEMIKNNKQIYNFNIHDDTKIYNILNILQYMKILNKFTFLTKYKNILYVHMHKNDDDNLLLYLFDYINSNNKKYKYDVEIEYLSIVHNKDTKLNKKYDMMFFFLSHRFDDITHHEQFNIENLLLNLTIILKNINNNGSAIIYFPSLFEKATQSIILILQLFFDKVHLYHPHFYMYSWANWVICEKFSQLNNDVEINIINELDNIVKNININKPKPYNKIINNKIFNNYHLYNAPLFAFNHTIYKNNEYFMDPPKFNKNKYLGELLEFYINYDPLLKINNFYIKRALYKDIKFMQIYNGMLLINIYDYDIYENIIQKKFTSHIYMLNSSVKIINNICELCNENNIELFSYDNIKNINYLFECIIIKNENYKIVELLKIWNLLKNNGVIIFFCEKLNNLKCFLEEIATYMLIENNSNIVIKKI
jgi:hypothetical protein